MVQPSRTTTRQLPSRWVDCTAYAHLSVSTCSRGRPRSRRCQSIPTRSSRCAAVYWGIIRRRSGCIVFRSVKFVSAHGAMQDATGDHMVAGRVLQLHIEGGFHYIDMVRQRRPSLNDTSTVRSTFATGRLTLRRPFVATNRGGHRVDHGRPVVGNGLRDKQRQQFNGYHV